MCRCTAQPNALRPRVFAEAVVVFALAWLEKNNNYNKIRKKKESLNPAF